MKILLKNLRILTFNINFDEILGDIFIEDGIIKEIMAVEVIKPDNDTVVYDFSNKVAMPGLINSHTHLPMSIFKGLGHATPDIIYNIMFPAEKNLRSNDIETITRAGAVECLMSGITTVVEHYYFADEIAHALKKVGLRAYLGHTTMDLMGPHVGEKQFKASYDFIDIWKNDELITPVLAPHATDTVSEEKLIELLKFSQKENLLLHLHVAQTKRELDCIRKKYGKTPVEFLESIGFLSENVLAAHLIYTNDNDIDIIAKRNVNFLCSPVSQLFFERLAPIEKLWKKGVNFCLATDCVASNDGMNLFSEGRVLNLLLIKKENNPLVIDSKEILSMATRNAAKALKAENKIGSLEVGKIADILILDLNKPRTSPCSNIYNSLLYAFSERDIECVMVNGKILIENGKPKYFDEYQLSRDLTTLASDIFSRK